MSKEKTVVLEIEEILSWRKIVKVPKNISNNELTIFLMKQYRNENIVLNDSNFIGTDYRVTKTICADEDIDAKIVKENNELTFKYLKK